jgi:lysozyme family protein
MSFELAFEHVIGHEGGYVNDSRDPGGETKFGISKRAYPGEDIKNLTKERAFELYRADYWSRIRGDELPDGIALCLFDYAVNSGVSQAIRTLQRAVGTEVDGRFGPATMAALKARQPRSLIVDYQSERLLFLSRLTTFDTYGRGWTRRVISTALEALG